MSSFCESFNAEYKYYLAIQMSLKQYIFVLFELMIVSNSNGLEAVYEYNPV